MDQIIIKMRDREFTLFSKSDGRRTTFHQMLTKIYRIHHALENMDIRISIKALATDSNIILRLTDQKLHIIQRRLPMCTLVPVDNMSKASNAERTYRVDCLLYLSH